MKSDPREPHSQRVAMSMYAPSEQFVIFQSGVWIAVYCQSMCLHKPSQAVTESG